jgi:ERCC4-type nuclease
MDNFELQNILKSFSVIVDTREQPTARAKKRYADMGVEYNRAVLDYGDYTYDFMLPNGKWLHEDVGAVQGDSVIERKMSLRELSGNLCQNWDRFCREFDRAKEHGASVYLLVEDASWVKIFTGKYGTKFNSKAYLHRLLKLIGTYQIKPIFVPKDLSGQMIYEILYREAKRRLESGEYG